MNYAGFWIRVVAALIDGVIVGVLGGVTTTALFGADAGMSGIVIGMLYYGLFHGGGWQATPGKRLIGLRVIRPDGANLTHGRAFARYFATWVSGLILGIGFIMAGLTREKTALHDMICDTRVVYGKA